MTLYIPTILHFIKPHGKAQHSVYQYKTVTIVDVILVTVSYHFIFDTVVQLLLIIQSANSLLKMSSINKKRRKSSFLNKISRIFKRKYDELGQQSEFYGQTGALDNRQFDNLNKSDNLKSISHNSDNKIVPLAINKKETCITVVKDSLFGTEEYSDKDISDMYMQQSCKNIIKNDKSFRLETHDIENNKKLERKKYYVTKNEQGKCKLGSDRYMSTKMAFLKEDNNLCVTSQSYLKNANNRTGYLDSDSKSANLQLCTNNINITNNICALIKEKKAICQESSEDSDFSADSTEDSFEESSEDENEHLIESEKTQKYLKDEYFTKGKYITYFFLEMERQFYNPLEVYKMVQYHDTACEKPEKEGIK